MERVQVDNLVQAIVLAFHKGTPGGIHFITDGKI